MPERILLSAAGPYRKVGKLSLQPPSEVLDADSLGRVVPRQHQIQALGLGGQAVVKAKLPREEDIRLLADRVRNEVPTRATDESQRAGLLLRARRRPEFAGRARPTWRPPQIDPKSRAPRACRLGLRLTTTAGRVADKYRRRVLRTSEPHASAPPPQQGAGWADNL